MEPAIVRIEVTESGRRWSIVGEIDAGNAGQLIDAVAHRPDTGDALVELHMEGVTFIDSSGLRALLQLADSVEAAGGSTVVRHPSEAVFKLVTITQLESRFGLG